MGNEVRYHSHDTADSQRAAKLMDNMSWPFGPMDYLSVLTLDVLICFGNGSTMEFYSLQVN